MQVIVKLQYQPPAASVDPELAKQHGENGIRQLMAESQLSFAVSATQPSSNLFLL